MKQYEMLEMSFPCETPEDAWAELRPEAVFTCEGETIHTEGFYAGNGRCKVRFLPMKSGHYDWKVTGCAAGEGSFEVEPAVSHGPVRTEGTAFVYADGTLFHPFGTTVYALISQSDALIEQTMQSLENAPFNKIRMCVFPKHYDYNHNEPAHYAFEKDSDGAWDPSRPNPAFWDALDVHLKRLEKMGMQVDLILFHPYDRWGFNGMGLEKDKIYLDYLIRRLSAYPHIWWSLANEYELCSRSEEDWFEIERFVAEHDPYHHLLSCHNIFKLWDAARPATTHASIQSKAFHRLGDWVRRYQKPVMLDECCYEGNIEHFWGSITGREMSRRFWRAVTSGAYCTHGETFYSDDEILWWARGGCLKGESPARIAFCREIIESLPGHLEKDEEFYDKLMKLARLDAGAQREMIPENLPEGTRRMLQAFLESGENMADQRASETVYNAHIGDEVFLRFYDTRPIARETLRLPEGRTYRIEVLDTWNMTRETAAVGVSGEYVVKLPGREDMAVLCVAE